MHRCFSSDLLNSLATKRLDLVRVVRLSIYIHADVYVCILVMVSKFVKGVSQFM